LSGWKYCQSALANMSEPLANAHCAACFMRPIDLTGDAASKVLGKTLNAKWHARNYQAVYEQVLGAVSVCVGAGRRVVTDVMDFFRPSTGTFWGFYDRVLSPFVVKTSAGWMVRTVGSLKLSFNPGLSASLSNAEAMPA